MITTAEISMYPFQDNYKELIKDCIRKLSEQREIRVIPGPTSTVIVGEYSRVMECLEEILPWSYDEHGRSVFVVKFILDYNPT